MAQAYDERNYHIFYELCSGAPKELKLKLELPILNTVGVCVCVCVCARARVRGMHEGNRCGDVCLTLPPLCALTLACQETCMCMYRCVLSMYW